MNLNINTAFVYFRFVHPGVLDKGNYNMFAPSRSSGHNNGPSGGYERPFDRPPVAAPMPPAEWANAGPRPGIDPRPPMRHPQVEKPRPTMIDYLICQC